MLNALFGTMSTRIFLIVVSGILITASLVNLLGQRDMRANESHIRAQFAYERIENIIGILDATIPDKRQPGQPGVNQRVAACPSPSPADRTCQPAGTTGARGCRCGWSGRRLPSKTWHAAWQTAIRGWRAAWLQATTRLPP